MLITFANDAIPDKLEMVSKLRNLASELVSRIESPLYSLIDETKSLSELEKYGWIALAYSISLRAL